MLGSWCPGTPSGALRARLVAVVGLIALGLLTGPIAGCGHQDAGSIDLTAAKVKAAEQGLNLRQPGSLKGRGRGTSKPKAQALKLEPSGRTTAKH